MAWISANGLRRLSSIRIRAPRGLDRPRGADAAVERPSSAWETLAPKPGPRLDLRSRRALETMSIVVYDLVVRAREESLPDRCPWCNASLRLKAALAIRRYRLEAEDTRLEAANERFAARAFTPGSEGLPTAYGCAQCGALLSGGVEYCLTEDSPNDLLNGFLVFLRAIVRWQHQAMHAALK